VFWFSLAAVQEAQEWFAPPSSTSPVEYNPFLPFGVPGTPGQCTTTLIRVVQRLSPARPQL
jgi:hypothetical protein